MVLMGIALGLSTGCAPAISEAEFDAEDPASVLYAIHEAGESRDASKVYDLIEHLDADDPAVRMFAIVALEKITGERHGYNPYAARPERQPAIAKWVELYPKPVSADSADPAGDTASGGAG